MIIFEGNTMIDNNLFQSATITSVNETNIEYKIRPEIDYEKFKILLNTVANISKDEQEKQHAIHAADLCDRDKRSLKSYIIDNISSFVSGTFATVAGGMVLEIIQNLIK
ncbi:MAG: hypothetical protein HDT46_10605 [Ruminococcaceae bacterium]|nr:hypothetical protein [Oscillospiraceae bacterium]